MLLTCRRDQITDDNQYQNTGLVFISILKFNTRKLTDNRLHTGYNMTTRQIKTAQNHPLTSSTWVHWTADSWAHGSKASHCEIGHISRLWEKHGYILNREVYKISFGTRRGRRYLWASSQNEVTCLTNKHASVLNQLLTVQESKASEEMADFTFTALTNRKHVSRLV